MMKVWTRMTAKVWSDSGLQVWVYIKIRVSRVCFWITCGKWEKKKSRMTLRVDPEQLELLLAEVKKTARGITFVCLFVCLQGRH